MEEPRTGNHIVRIHQELGAYGYELVRGDITQCSPLGNQARGHSKMPIVITYKDKDTKLNVTKAAKAASLWNWRVTKEKDKTKARRGYFKAPITGRHKHTPRPSHQKPRQRPKKTVNPTLRKTPQLQVWK
jgi:hypothetical protein